MKLDITTNSLSITYTEATDENFAKIIRINKLIISLETGKTSQEIEDEIARWPRWKEDEKNP